MFRLHVVFLYPTISWPFILSPYKNLIILGSICDEINCICCLKADVSDAKSDDSDASTADEPATDSEDSLDRQPKTRPPLLVEQYRLKKRMSSDLFRYIITATDAAQEEMKLMVAAAVRTVWQEKIILTHKVWI